MNQFDPGDQAQLIPFMKNIAIAGGFLVLAAHGAGTIGVDGSLAAHRAKGGAL